MQMAQKVLSETPLFQVRSMVTMLQPTKSGNKKAFRKQMLILIGIGKLDCAEHGIEIKAIHITDKETAQNMPAPVTMYALFRDGEFVTHGIQSDKKFFALAGISV